MIKINYLVIPAITILIALTGRFFSKKGMKWYHSTLRLPSITPPDWVFGVVWPIIFSLTTVVVIWIWNSGVEQSQFLLIMKLFGINALLNLSWSYLFFVKHLILLSVINSVLLLLITVLLIFYIWPIWVLMAFLLIPYALWLAFATYLDYCVWELNK